ncbi:MAG: 5-(carboxyamino)imidazole ribonucleotide synthase [Pseudomonadota bacterium]|nr:5-(carboxyamino)imidazole ribonucleotide synthase [Pseudomonadota bacterium]
MTTPLPPGSLIGILGGGQLGRMTVLAAAQMGYRCHVFSPNFYEPAKEVACAQTTASYDDEEAVRAFARTVDVVTFEFENIPDDTLSTIANLSPVRPNVEALYTSQDRALEKKFLNDQGIATVAWQAVTNEFELENAATEIGLPAILKTARFGYDGKGQSKVVTREMLRAAWSELGKTACVLEVFCPFEREISVSLARGHDGQTESYVPVDNVHREHILHTTTAPSSLRLETADRAIVIAQKIANSLDLVGLITVEMFVLDDGTVLVNEIAPRPHNSGHWTIDACTVSQFEQLVRAVVGLPLGSTVRHSNALMTNLIGRDADAWLELSAETNACLHLYGKSEKRPGRKMGHVTRLSPLNGLP